MKQLFTTFYQLKERVSLDFIRYLYHEIRWNNRLIAITGARGTGKTTLMLQRALPRLWQWSTLRFIRQYMVHHSFIIWTGWRVSENGRKSFVFGRSTQIPHLVKRNKKHLWQLSGHKNSIHRIFFIGNTQRRSRPLKKGCYLSSSWPFFPWILTIRIWI